MRMKHKPFIISGFIGLAVILISVISLFIFPQTAPGQIAGIRSPIIAFEFAQTVDEIHTLFGPDGSPEQADMIRKMDQGNILDYLYMLLYSSFLFSFALTIVKQSGKQWLYLGAVLAILALIGDALENIQLLTITAHLPSGDIVAALARLHWFTWLKWGSLALYFLGASVWFRRNGRFGKIIAGLGIITFLLSLASFIQRGATTESFTLSVALMFLLMIIFCFTTKSIPENQSIHRPT
ncbi:MAG: hypothetical protein CSB13_09555 [Chloroflexi bacterium]|nr:MAG: hypothetical protein CSB13_09555 [Chloroflexota bacterium]